MANPEDRSPQPETYVPVRMSKVPWVPVVLLVISIIIFWVMPLIQRAKPVGIEISNSN